MQHRPGDIENAPADWQPGRPVVTVADHEAWQAWSKARKLDAQRERRQRLRRIDYYPSEDAQAAIDARTHGREGGDYSSVIDALIRAGAGRLPE